MKSYFTQNVSNLSLKRLLTFSGQNTFENITLISLMENTVVKIKSNFEYGFPHKRKAPGYY